MNLFNLGTALFRSKHNHRDLSDKPWLKRSEWSTPVVRSRAKAGMWTAWLGAIFWNLIAFPAAYLVIRDISQQEKAALFVLVFPLFGLGVLAWAIRATLTWKRFGETPLTMDPWPGAIGGQVGGTMDVALPFDPNTHYKAKLICAYSYMSGGGKNRSRQERVIWQSDGYAHTRSWAGKTRLEILFDVQDRLPPSDVKKGSSYHLWRLHVEAKLPGADFTRAFELPVFPTGENAQQLQSLSTEHSRAAEDRSRAIESVLDIRHIPGGVELYYPPFRHPGSRLGAILFGCVFIGAGAAAGMAGAPIVFPILFPLVGAAVGGYFLYKLLLSLRVRLNEQWLETEKRLLGCRAGGRRIARPDILGLSLKKSYSASSGHKHVAYYKLRALVREDKPVDIGYNLPGREVAQEALESLSLLTGVPVRDDEQSARAAVA